MKRLLILDDDKDRIRMIKSDLSPLGLEVKILETESAEGALLILEGGVDVAYIDRYLGDKDIGVNFIKENASRFKNVNFYLHSSHEDKEAIEDIIRNGGKGFINKRGADPIDYARPLGFSEDKLKSCGYVDIPRTH